MLEDSGLIMGISMQVCDVHFMASTQNPTFKLSLTCRVLIIIMSSHYTGLQIDSCVRNLSHHRMAIARWGLVHLTPNYSSPPLE